MATTPNAGFSLGPTRRFTEAVSDTVVAYNLIGARGAVSLIFMRDGDGWTGADLGIHQPLPAPTGRACHLLGELHCSYDGSSLADDRYVPLHEAGDEDQLFAELEAIYSERL